MTRHATDRLNRVRSQRRILAAGVRFRGQWRYLVRTSNDPFTLGEEATSDSSPERPPGARPGTHRPSLQKSA
jgi:hypothetical protein